MMIMMMRVFHPSCRDWKHGAVFVNGFNIGRYHQAGPQKTLYIPGPLLNFGDNEIIVFENYLGDQVRTSSYSSTSCTMCTSSSSCPPDNALLCHPQLWPARHHQLQEN